VVEEDHSKQPFDVNLKNEKIPLKTDDEIVEREERRMNSDGYSVAEQKVLDAAAEKYQFQTEVNRLMNIIINSLYSHREIFLREAISNASDALDKIRFLGLTNKEALGEGDLAQLDIRIRANKEKKLLHIIDKGVGMTKQDLINNLGTIAQSGTREFVEKIGKEAADQNLIGQFGVGFYSYFLVADKITVTTKHHDDKQYVWESTAASGYTIAEDPQGNTLGRGTRITLHIKEDAEEFLDSAKIKELIKKYSEFINFPIYVWTETEEDVEVPIEEEAGEEKKEEEKKADEEVKIEDEEDEEAEKPKTKTVKRIKAEWVLANETKPIWTRKPSDIAADEYNSFYKAITKDWEEPLAYVHFNAEGDVEFKSILYIPKRAPENMYAMRSQMKGLKLYVKRVFITEDFDNVMPTYLMFIRGVVDSDDLPLNVSREVLQHDKALITIKKKLVRKAIGMMQDLAANEKEKFDTFYKEFSSALKLGVVEDYDNRTRLSKLLRYYSSQSGDNQTASFDDYVGRMKKGQTDIYFIAGENKDALEKSPLIERFLKRGFEVLYMVDAMDEYVMNNLDKFDGKYKLVNIAKEGVKLPGEEENAEEEKKNEEEFKDLLSFLKTALGDKIDKAVLSNRLLQSPSALSTAQWGATANMERIMKAQALGRSAFPQKARRVMEINPRHPILVELNRQLKEAGGPESATDKSRDIAFLLYDTAALNSGFSVEDPAQFATRINRLIKLNLGIDPSAEAPIPEIPLAEEKTDEKADEETKKKENKEDNDEDDHVHRIEL
jgi:heat shock protein beta